MNLRRDGVRVAVRIISEYNGLKVIDNRINEHVGLRIRKKDIRIKMV